MREHFEFCYIYIAAITIIIPVLKLLQKHRMFNKYELQLFLFSLLCNILYTFFYSYYVIQMKITHLKYESISRTNA
jgi:hypothetical protein